MFRGEYTDYFKRRKERYLEPDMEKVSSRPQDTDMWSKIMLLPSAIVIASFPLSPLLPMRMRMYLRAFFVSLNPWNLERTVLGRFTISSDCNCCSLMSYFHGMPPTKMEVLRIVRLPVDGGPNKWTRELTVQ